MKITKKLIDYMLMSMFYIALIGLILTPVFPWITEDIVTEEGRIWISKMEMSEIDDENISSINSNINYTSGAFSFSILFALIGRVGVLARKIKKKLLANYLIMSSIPLLLSSAVTLIFSIRVLFMINSLGETYSLGYNYVHIALSIPLFFISLLFAFITVPRARKGIVYEKRKRLSKRHNVKSIEDQSNKEIFKRNENQNFENEDEPVKVARNYECSRCKQPVNKESLLCRDCGNNLSVRCTKCGKIFPDNREECPDCGMSLYNR